MALEFIVWVTEQQGCDTGTTSTDRGIPTTHLLTVYMHHGTGSSSGTHGVRGMQARQELAATAVPLACIKYRMSTAGTVNPSALAQQPQDCIAHAR